MTDKEIAWKLAQSRCRAMRSKLYANTNRPIGAVAFAIESTRIIHHIINSINWED